MSFLKKLFGKKEKKKVEAVRRPIPHLFDDGGLANPANPLSPLSHDQETARYPATSLFHDSSRQDSEPGSDSSSSDSGSSDSGSSDGGSSGSSE